MHEHLRARIRDIGALQTDMWTKGQDETAKNRRVKQMFEHRLTHRGMQERSNATYVPNYPLIV